MHQFAEPGELLKEFEKEQERQSKEEEERRKEEEKASADLIAQLAIEQVCLNLLIALLILESLKFFHFRLNVLRQMRNWRE
jgi:hypothetical protein